MRGSKTLFLGALVGLCSACSRTSTTLNQETSTNGNEQSSTPSSSVLSASTTFDTSSDETGPGSDAKAFFSYDDPKAPCRSTLSSSLGWELKLLRSNTQIKPYGATEDPRGGLWLTGEEEGQLWLGRVGSDGTWVGSKQLQLGPGGRRVGTSISRDAQGQLAIAGTQSTDLVDFSEPVGVFFKAKSLLPEPWRANDMQGRPSANGQVRLLSEDALVVSGTLRYADNKRGAFLAKLDYRGNKTWAIDQTSWDLSAVYDIVLDNQGSIYAVGGIRPAPTDVARERAIMVKIGAEGVVQWKRFLEPEPSHPVFSRSTQIALSLDEKRVWAGGVMEPLTEHARPHAWSLDISDGTVLSSVDMQAPSVWKNGSLHSLAAFLVQPDGIYYAWNGQLRVGEDSLGWVSRVVRMNEQGQSTWSTEYTPSRQPGAIPHVFIRELKSATAGGIYVVGERRKVPIPDASPVGEHYGYVARFCPP